MIAIRNRHFALLDLTLLALSAYLSYVFRLEKFRLGAHSTGCAVFVVLSVLICLPVLWRSGIYRRYWRYASLDEGLLLVGAMTAAAILLGAATLLIARFGGPLIPRSIPFIFLLLGLVVTAGPRFLYRFLARNRRRRARQASGPARGDVRAVVVMGAGEAGVLVVREMLDNPQLGMEPVAFADDDPDKLGVRVHGVRVAGNRRDLPRLASQHGTRQVIIAMPTASGASIREVVNICSAAGLQARILPSISELIDGSVSLRQLREVRIEDLLRREPVATEVGQAVELLRGRRVLVTGAGGSIGSELCRQILKCEPSELTLLGHGENSIYEILSELQGLAVNRKCRLIPQIADVRDEGRLGATFALSRPEVVFHAAAHKHVPLMEENPVEAISNNILGTRNVLRASEAADVTRFVLISTDKAVNPTNVMGATKRVAEHLVRQSAALSGRHYCAVRFGNVLGSRGSVVNTFTRQIALGGPVTVTHPDIKRFFMTIPEAVQLVLQAAAMVRGGETFVLDMGEPIKIVDLARDMILLSGLVPDQDIAISYTGLRPGEKLYEELFFCGETHRRTSHEKIFIVRNADDSHDDELTLSTIIAQIEEAVRRQDETSALMALQRAVPEYCSCERWTGAQMPAELARLARTTVLD